MSSPHELCGLLPDRRRLHPAREIGRDSGGAGPRLGAGSLVAYALTITDLDPIRFGLLFERFLNPESVSMPDFDIDFCRTAAASDRLRAAALWPRSVAQIITFGTLQARGVLRDGRARAADALWAGRQADKAGAENRTGDAGAAIASEPKLQAVSRRGRRGGARLRHRTAPRRADPARLDPCAGIVIAIVP